MKKRFSRGLAAFLTVLVMSVLFTACGGSGSGGSGADKGRVTEVAVNEHGGEDGRSIDWRVYREGDKFYISYADNNGQYFSHYYGIDDKATVEISESAYNEVMNIDYGKLMNAKSSKAENAADDVGFTSTLRYENGTEQKTGANMTSVTISLIQVVLQFRQ